MKIMGPFDTLEAVARRMRETFGQECRTGQDKVANHLADGSLLDVPHIISRIDQDPARIKTCRIITEENAEIKALLPSVVFYVGSMRIDVKEGEDTPHESLPIGNARVHGTFTSKAGATSKARRVAQRIADADSDAERAFDLGEGDEVPGVVRSWVVLCSKGRMHLVHVRRVDSAIAPAF